MKLKVYNKNILHLIFNTQKELTFTLCRPQEYYECDSTKLRGKVFTFESFIDHYTDDNGYMTYFNYWSGFNIPCNVLETFYKSFELNDREKKLKQLTKPFSNKLYYLIATKKQDTETLRHELIHAHYYLNPVYKQEVNVLVKHMRTDLKKNMTTILKHMGYNSSVMIDEINAYMSSSGIKYLKEEWDLDVTKQDILPFEALAKLVLRD